MTLRRTLRRTALYCRGNTPPSRARMCAELRRTNRANCAKLRARQRAEPTAPEFAPYWVRNTPRQPRLTRAARTAPNIYTSP